MFEKNFVTNQNYQRFLDDMNNPNSRKVARLYHAIGDYDFEHNNTVEELQDLIISLKPHCLKEIHNIVNIIKLWVKYSYSETVYNKIYNLLSCKELDKESLWKIVKPNVPRKFISHKQYIEIVKDIDVYEDANPEYLQTLFMSIYEGLYCKDYSVTWNLRGNDIDGDMVTIRYANNSSHTLQVSRKLTENLLFMSDVKTTRRKNHNNSFDLPVSGLYPDTCFKLERRELRGKGINYQNSYGNQLRKIVKEYVEYPLTAQQLYVSGIMYRIGLMFKEKGITLEEAFRYDNRNRVVGGIIRLEFERINAPFDVNNFRENVRGFIDVFNEDWI